MRRLARSLQGRGASRRAWRNSPNYHHGAFYDPADSYLIILFANTSAERAYRYTHY
jgi:hypothetical protein